MDLNWLDITVLLLVFISVITGISAGFIQRAAGIISTIGAVAIAFILYELAGAIILKYELVNNRAVADIGSFIILLLVTYVLLRFIGWILKSAVDSLHLKWLDRLTGGFFGLITGLGLSVLLVSAVGYFMNEAEPPISDSRAVPYLRSFMGYVREHAPENTREELKKVQKYIKDKGKQIEDKIDKNLKEDAGNTALIPVPGEASEGKAPSATGSKRPE